MEEINNEDITSFKTEYSLFKKNRSLKIVKCINDLKEYERINQSKIDIEGINFLALNTIDLNQHQFGLIFAVFCSGKYFTKKAIQKIWNDCCDSFSSDFQLRHVGGQSGYPLFTGGELAPDGSSEGYLLKRGQMCYVKNTIPDKYLHLKRCGDAKLTSNICECCRSMQ